MRVAIIGANGQLGQSLVGRYGAIAIPLARSALDITNAQAVRDVLERLRPEVVINTAAYTTVDRAEVEVDLCRTVNIDGVRNLANYCAQFGSRLVQISTDYVFGGDTARCLPYREFDPPAPQSEYARSKLAGEQEAARCPRSLVVRTCGLYGSARPRTSFVETMLRFGRERSSVRVVNDQECTPSFVEDVAEAIAALVESQAEGTCHVTNSGSTHWSGFAEEIFRLAQMPVHVEPISSAEFGARVARPTYSVLDNSRLVGIVGRPLRDWRSALAAHLNERLARVMF